MPSLEARVQRLEDATSSSEPHVFVEFVRSLPPVANGEFDWDAAAPEWCSTFRPWLEELGGTEKGCLRRLANPLERGIARLLGLLEESIDPFAFERYRGLVPDRVLTTLYSERRNWVATAEISQRVRQLAGVMDEQGNVLPGYVLAPNGCIIDAEVDRE